MIPYFLLLLVAGLFCFVSISSTRGRTVLIIGYNANIKKNLCTGVFFLVLFVLLAFRDVSVGNDTRNYQYFFFQYSKMSLVELLDIGDEGLYRLLNWSIAKLTNRNFQLYIAMTSALTIVPLAKLYMEDQSHSFLQIVLFVNMSIFVMLFSGIRQAIAMSIGVFSLRYIRKGKLLKYLLCIALAFGFHTSSFILLLMYPVYNLKIGKKDLWLVIPVIIAVLFFSEQLFGFLVGILAIFSPEYAESEVSQTGAYAMIILFALFTVFAYVIPDEKKMTRDLLGLRNLLLLSALLQCFAPLHALAMRMNYYFIPFVPAVMVRTMNVYDSKYKNVVQWAEVILCIFFTASFLSSVFQAASTGGMLHIVPYIPFWEG